MKEIIKVKNADALFESIKGDEMFSAKDSVSGLSIRYNGIFMLLANPIINIIKQDDSTVEVRITANKLLKAVAVFFTIFFWGIAVFAIVKSKLNAPAIIIIFLLPSVMWLLNSVFNSQIKKIIIDEIKKHDI